MFSTILTKIAYAEARLAIPIGSKFVVVTEVINSSERAHLILLFTVRFSVAGSIDQERT